MAYLFSFLFIFTTTLLQAQTTIAGQVQGISQRQVIVFNVPFTCWYYKQLSQPVTTNADGRFSFSISIKKPQSIFFEVNGKRMLLYVEPGKNLYLTFDSAAFQASLQFAGSLKTENDFRKETGLSFFHLYPQNWSDSLSAPGEIIARIKTNEKAALNKLQPLKGKTSQAFWAMTKADIEYFASFKLWEIIFSNREPLRREREAWSEALQSAYQAHLLSNNSALNSFYYQNMIAYYPRFLNTGAPTKEAFQKNAETVLGKPLSEAFEEVKQKGERFWQYKALQYGLSGPALEQALASFIDNGIYLGELGYLQEAYSDFTFRFPKSPHHSHLTKVMAGYFASLTENNSPGISFEPSDSYKSIEAILEKLKGKVVYIDLWGTWCGPCREEFAYNEALKTYFAGKPVYFLYIAFEHSRGNPEPAWKKTVRYYKLTGKHILAGEALKQSIENLYQPEGMKGFPSYILVDKNGKVHSLFAQRPSTQVLLYKQIDELLK